MKIAAALLLSILKCSFSEQVEAESVIDTCSANDTNDPSCKAARSIPTYKETCRFYLAPSSIPNSGFGVYTVDFIPAKTPISHVADAPSIVVTDVLLHNDGKTPNWNHHNYFWDGSGQGEFEAATVEEGVVTFGSLCNYHTYLHNIKPFSPPYDDAITPRSSGSPGMGAYSYNPGFHFRSTRDINAGEEVFCNYGETWLDGRTFGSVVPREEDFSTAGEIIKKTLDGLSETDEINGE